MPDVLCFAPKEVEDRRKKAERQKAAKAYDVDREGGSSSGQEQRELNRTNASRRERGQIPRSKQRKMTIDQETTKLRRSPRTKKTSSRTSQGLGASVKRSLDDVYSAEDGDGVNSNDDSDSSMDNDNGNDNEDFDLFASSVKQDWSSHPQFKALMDSGLQMIKTIGFMSPKTGQGSNKTMKSLATTVGIKNLPSRATAEPLIVRAMAIKRLKTLDPMSEATYTDLETNE